MTSKQSDTELLELRRKVCEALNISTTEPHSWPSAKDGFYYCPKCGIKTRRLSPEFVATNPCYPALESDNGLALDTLVQWCNGKPLQWEVKSASHRLGFICHLWSTKPEDYQHLLAGSGDGETPASRQTAKISATL